MEKYYIKTCDWEKIYNYLCTIKKVRVKNEYKTRVFAEAVYFIMRTGAHWRELPSHYGKFRSVHKRFHEWASCDLWQELLEHFTKDHDGESVMIDATIIRAHPCAAGYEKDQGPREALGRSKGGFTTKIHVVVDALGQALKFSLTPGQRHDITQASSLLVDYKGRNVIADKAYDADSLINQLYQQNCTPVIPCRKNRKIQRTYDEHIYKERHLIECFFNKLKQFRRIFSRYDKQASSYAGFIAYASSILWLR